MAGHPPHPAARTARIRRRSTTSPSAERAALAALEQAQASGTGYSLEQSTRPQTIGYALVDSPVALCAWIIEKFRAWTDCDGHPENALTRDELLDNLMLYWLPGTGASVRAGSTGRASGRSSGSSAPDARHGDVPTGCSIFPKENPRPSRRWAEKRFTDIRYWNEPDKGGHFAAFEQPELFVDEVRAFFRLVRGAPSGPPTMAGADSDERIATYGPAATNADLPQADKSDTRRGTPASTR